MASYSINVCYWHSGAGSLSLLWLSQPFSCLMSLSFNLSFLVSLTLLHINIDTELINSTICQWFTLATNSHGVLTIKLHVWVFLNSLV